MAQLPDHEPVTPDPATLRDAVTTALDGGPNGWWYLDTIRWPNARTGDRDPIPPLTRALILRRDNFRCAYCQTSNDLQLDHVVPWSAGGPDTSDNLRTLCATCNEDRSNYREAYLPRTLPATVVCDPCLATHDNDTARRHNRAEVMAHCPACTGHDWPTDGLHYPAWCGTCNSTSWVGDPGRLL